MKLLEQDKIQKQVMYKNLELTVHIATQFVAADMDGELFSFYRKPVKRSRSFVPDHDDEAYLRVGVVAFEPGESWADSCERVFSIT